MKTGINFELVEKFWGFVGNWEVEREDLVLRRGILFGRRKLGICWDFCWVVLGFGMYLLGCIGLV